MDTLYIILIIAYIFITIPMIGREVEYSENYNYWDYMLMGVSFHIFVLAASLLIIIIALGVYELIMLLYNGMVLYNASNPL